MVGAANLIAIKKFVMRRGSTTQADLIAASVAACRTNLETTLKTLGRGRGPSHLKVAFIRLRAWLESFLRRHRG